MLQCPKSLLLSVRNWVNGEENEGETGWGLQDARAVIAPEGFVIRAWQDWRKYGVYPYPGGYVGQPLDLLVKMQALEAVFVTFSYLRNEKADWSKLTKGQRELVRWIENG